MRGRESGSDGELWVEGNGKKIGVVAPASGEYVWGVRVWWGWECDGVFLYFFNLFYFFFLYIIFYLISFYL